MATLKELIQKAGEVAILKAHPVGSYFITEEDKNPNEILGLMGGVAEWIRLTNRVLIGAGDNYPVGSEGGEATHVLSEAELPALSGKLYMHYQRHIQNRQSPINTCTFFSR